MKVTQEAPLPDQAPVLSLPEELLDRIISTVCSMAREELGAIRYTRDYKESMRYEAPATLCLVCRRFNRIAVPYLYADLRLWTGPHSNQPGKTPELMHRSCRKNLSLWPLCRRLSIHFIGSCPAALSRDDRRLNQYLYVATDFSTWFTATRSFELFGLTKDERAWTLLHLALKHMTELSELSVEVGRRSYDLDLPRVIETIADLGPQSTIRVLGLHGVSAEQGDRCRSTLQTKAGTGLVTGLKLTSFLQSPEVLEDLVRWPSKLEEFSLEFVYGCCYSVEGVFEDWSLATLRAILSVHRSTLRSIRITNINIGGLAGFDLREFTALETLSLSAASTSSNPRWKTLIPNLIAPRLRVFHWDLTLEDQQHCESLEDFQQAEEDFLRDVAHAAIAQGCPLRRIEITFTPWFCNRFDGIYPWGRMDALDRELQPKGIRVCYNEPKCPAWEAYLESVRQAQVKQECQGKLRPSEN